jgi:hypothetical protein
VNFRLGTGFSFREHYALPPPRPPFLGKVRPSLSIDSCESLVADEGKKMNSLFFQQACRTLSHSLPLE